MDWTSIFALYIAWAAALLAAGIWLYTQGFGRETRLGARMILAAPIWPLAAIAIIGWALTKTPRILRDIITTARNKP